MKIEDESQRKLLQGSIAENCWRELQEFRHSQARKLGIEESDVERLIVEDRAERSGS